MEGPAENTVQLKLKTNISNIQIDFFIVKSPYFINSEIPAKHLIKCFAVYSLFRVNC